MDWCWSGTWTDANVVTDLWTDDTHALAAGGSSILAFDGRTWVHHRLEVPLPSVSMLAVSAFDDAWFTSPHAGQIVHLSGDELLGVELPVDEVRVLSLCVDSEGFPWVLLRPSPPCTLGPCSEGPSQLFRYDGDTWSETEDAEWLEQVDIADDTIWGLGTAGEVGTAGLDGGPWQLLPLGAGGLANEVHAVSATETWIRGGDDWWHYVDGQWAQGSVLGSRAMTVGADGNSWWVAMPIESEFATLGSVGEDGWVPEGNVPDAAAVAVGNGDEVLVGGRGETGAFPVFGNEGLYVHRVTNLDASATVTTEFALDDVGDFFDMFAPQAETVLGLRPNRRAQLLEDGGWATLDTDFLSVWGTSADALWAVSGDRRLLRIVDGVTTPVDFPVEDPGLIAVWGTADDDVFVCGVRTVGQAGVSNELLVAHWDGNQWHDVSPDLQNVGGRIDMHGTDSHLYVKTPLGVYRWDGSVWESTASLSPFVELYAIRAYSTEAVFVLDANDTLLVLDGSTWSVAADVWPELAGVTGPARLFGNATAGIYLSLSMSLSGFQDDGSPDELWVYQGEGWTQLELPEGLHRGARISVAEDGSALWAEDGSRVWNARPCE